MHASYILSALAAAGLAAAECSTSATMTIQNAGDASALASCKTFSGSIAIATQTSDDIAINFVEVITGDLSAVQATDFSSLSADSLQTIKGTFKLNFARSLSALDFPQLSSVGSIDWNNLHTLSGLGFDTGIQTAGTISITDTSLASLDGIDPSSIDSLTLNSNGFLTKLDLSLDQVTDQLTIIGPSDNPMSLGLPNLKKGKTFNIASVSSLDISNLQSVKGPFSISESSMKVFEAPKLTEAGSTFTIAHNSVLSQLKLTKLETIGGGFVITSCPKLVTVDGLDSLTTTGDLDFSGNFETVHLPALKAVKGAFNLQSTGDIQSECSTFKAEHGPNDVIQGKLTCRPKDKTPKDLNGQTSDGSHGGTTGGSGGGDSGAGMVFPSIVVVGVATALSAVLGLF